MDLGGVSACVLVQLYTLGTNSSPDHNEFG